MIKRATQHIKFRGTFNIYDIKREPPKLKGMFQLKSDHIKT